MKKHFKQIAMGLTLAIAISMAAPAVQTSYAATEAYDVTLGTPTRREITEETLEVGEKIDLNFYGVKDWNQNKPNYKCKWSVSGEAVVVDNWGVVTAVKAGTAVVSLTVTDKLTGISHNIKPATFIVEEQTAEPTVEPTTAPTEVPEPTATPVPTAAVALKEIDLGNKTFVAANGGVIIFSEEVDGENRYGAMDYSGFVIVKPEYEHFTTPDTNGYFMLLKGLDDRWDMTIFNKYGKEIFKESKESWILAADWRDPADGVFCYLVSCYDSETKSVSDWVKAYDAKSNCYLFEKEEADLEVSLKNCDNYTLVYEVWDELYSNGYEIIVDLSTGNVKEEMDIVGAGNLCSYEMYLVSPAYEGYSLVGVWEHQDYHYYSGLMSEDRSVAYLINLAALDYVKNSNYSDGGLKWGYSLEGIPHLNDEMKIVLTSTDGYMIVDFSKTACTGSEEYYIGDLEGQLADKVIVVDDFDNVIVAEYGYITMSEYGWHLVEHEGQWCYIDADNNLITDFDDCADFRGKYTAVVDDGTAYIINQKLEKVLEICQADGISSYGDIICVQNNDTYRYFVITEK